MPHIPDHLHPRPRARRRLRRGRRRGPTFARPARARRLAHRVRRPASRPARDRERPARAAPPRSARATSGSRPSRRRRCSPRVGAARSPPSPRPASAWPRPGAWCLPPPALWARCSRAGRGSQPTPRACRCRGPDRGGVVGDEAAAASDASGAFLRPGRGLTAGRPPPFQRRGRRIGRGLGGGFRRRRPVSRTGTPRSRPPDRPSGYQPGRQQWGAAGAQPAVSPGKEIAAGAVPGTATGSTEAMVVPAAPRPPPPRPRAHRPGASSRQPLLLVGVSLLVLRFAARSIAPLTRTRRRGNRARRRDRQGMDMPHIPDHATHDPEPVAAYAVGDASGPDPRPRPSPSPRAPSAPTCIATRPLSPAPCPNCPPAVRPRDFRITPEQAAVAAPSGWRGVLAAFASPRFKLAAPRARGSPPPASRACCSPSPGGLPRPGHRRVAPSPTEWRLGRPGPVEAPAPTTRATGALGRGLRARLTLAPAASRRRPRGRRPWHRPRPAAASHVPGALAPEAGSPPPPRSARTDIRGFIGRGRHAGITGRRPPPHRDQELGRRVRPPAPGRGPPPIYRPPADNTPPRCSSPPA